MHMLSEEEDRATVKFGNVVFEICKRTDKRDKQTNKHRNKQTC